MGRAPSLKEPCRILRLVLCEVCAGFFVQPGLENSRAVCSGAGFGEASQIAPSLNSRRMLSLAMYGKTPYNELRRHASD